LKRALSDAGVEGPDGKVVLILETEGVSAESADRVASILSDLLDVDYEQQARLQKRAAAGEVAAGVVHETRNILGLIRGFAQVALTPAIDDAKREKLLTRLEAETTRCMETVARFLHFSRDNQATHEQIDVNALLREAAELLTLHTRTRRVTIKTTLGEQIPPIWGNAGELLQVLVNLGLNGQQAMPAGGELEFVSTQASDGMVSLWVNDTGAGVPAELREKIFEPFFTTDTKAGTGLGLSLCRQTAIAHGGTLELRDSATGASFDLRLPALRNAGADEDAG